MMRARYFLQIERLQIFKKFVFVLISSVRNKKILSINEMCGTFFFFITKEFDINLHFKFHKS